MAEIMVERRPKKGPWRWLVLLAVLVLLGAAGWYFLAGPGEGTLVDEETVEFQESPGALPDDDPPTDGGGRPR